MTTIDAFTAVNVEALRALGGDAIPELLRIVQRRADAAETSFTSIARHLPNGWRHIIMAAHVVEGIESAGSLAGAFVDIRNKRDLTELEGFLAMLGAEQLALALEEARETTPLLIDEEMDPFDIEELLEVKAERLGLSRVRAELMNRVRTMATDFPAG